MTRQVIEHAPSRDIEAYLEGVSRTVLEDVVRALFATVCSSSVFSLDELHEACAPHIKGDPMGGVHAARAERSRLVSSGRLSWRVVDDLITEFRDRQRELSDAGKADSEEARFLREWLAEHGPS